jgi:hypothetical protein
VQTVTGRSVEGGRREGIQKGLLGGAIGGREASYQKTSSPTLCALLLVAAAREVSASNVSTSDPPRDVANRCDHGPRSGDNRRPRNYKGAALSCASLGKSEAGKEAKSNATKLG